MADGQSRAGYRLASTYQKFGPKMEALGPWGTPNTKGVYDVEDMVGMLKFKNGATILLEASWASRCEREWVWSTSWATRPARVSERVFEVDGIDDTSVNTLKVFSQDHGGPVDRKLIVEPDQAMGRHNSVKHFVDCLTDPGVRMISPATDGQRIMKVLRRHVQVSGIRQGSERQVAQPQRGRLARSAGIGPRRTDWTPGPDTGGGMTERILVLEQDDKQRDGDSLRDWLEFRGCVLRTASISRRRASCSRRALLTLQ